MAFTLTVVERTAVKTAGLKVRTDMRKAKEDCPKLWDTDFGPRMMSFPVDPARPGESYSVSIMIDSDAFDYWAVMPITPSAEVPDGMDILDIPGGLYAECPVASLAESGDAYTYVYMEWAATQEKYALNMQGASLELYTPDFMKDGRLTILCPLVEK